MSLQDPQQVYPLLWKAIRSTLPLDSCWQTRHATTTTKTLSVLQQYFSRTQQQQQQQQQQQPKHCIILVDELDAMMNKNQKVLYNLFEWPTRPNSRLVLIGIANTMNLPEQMQQRVFSRISTKNQIFKSYSVEQVKEIVECRLDDEQVRYVFTEEAIEMAARKVASVSGDIRRALHMCRRAAEICLQRYLGRQQGRQQQQQQYQQQRPMVTIEDVNRAAKEFTENYQITTLESASVNEQLLCIAVATHSLQNKIDQVDVVDVVTRFQQLQRQRSLRDNLKLQTTTTSQLLEMCEQLSSLGLLLLKCPHTNGSVGVLEALSVLDGSGSAALHTVSSCGVCCRCGNLLPQQLQVNLSPQDIAYALRNNSLASQLQRLTS